MNAAALPSLAILAPLLAIVIATSATARERTLRTAYIPPDPLAATATLCAFKAPQVSGYRARAGERRICYYDCGGSHTAIVIRADGLCSADQTVLVRTGDTTLARLERRPRGNGISPLAAAARD